TRARVLEIGSGTGRMLAGLASAGHEVVGVEPSEAMRTRAVTRLAALPERVSRRVTQLAGSANDLPSGLGRFDLALYSLGTLAHVLTAEERVASLRATRALLSESGAAMIDLDQAGLGQLLAAHGRRRLIAKWRVPGRAEQVAHYAWARRDPVTAIVTVRHSYQISTGRERSEEARSEMAFALLDGEAVLRELAAASYGPTTTWGDHTGTRLDVSSPRLIVLAEGNASAHSTTNL
ncbi:MAG TPA: class I SAM-dependent methyltransferase, partial [Ktedonobacterales bacterium]